MELILQLAHYKTALSWGNHSSHVQSIWRMFQYYGSGTFLIFTVHKSIWVPLDLHVNFMGVWFSNMQAMDTRYCMLFSTEITWLIVSEDPHAFDKRTGYDWQLSTVYEEQLETKFWRGTENVFALSLAQLLLWCWRHWCYPLLHFCERDNGGLFHCGVTTNFIFILTIHSSMGGLPGNISEEPVTWVKQKNGWRMNCDVGEAREELENELWCR